MSPMEQFVWKANKDIFKGVGIYHLTVAVSGRQPLLGWLVNDVSSPRVERTDLGSAVARSIEYLPVHYEGVKILTKCIMPDHVHLVLHLYENHGYSIKEISRGLRQAWRKDYNRLNGINMPTMSASEQPIDVNMPTMSVNINRQIVSAESYQHASQTKLSIPPLFEAPYIRTLAHRGQLDAMIRYVQDNPRRAMLRRQNSDLFKLRRDTRVGEFRFTSLGNLFLLDYPDKQPVICSRTLTEQQIAAQQTVTLRQAENGCITVTAAISNGEKQITRAVWNTAYPLIILLKDGFPKAGDEREKYYKPGGAYFEACVAGRLLLLEPTADTLNLPEIQASTEQTLREKAEARHWDYQPIPITSDRYRMMAANEIVKRLCP